MLLDKGYEVHGIIRRASIVQHRPHRPPLPGSARERDRLFLHYGDLTDATSLINLISEIRPDEVYNLAAQSHVKVSFEMPEYTGEATALGTLRLLEAVRAAPDRKARFYQASSSEMFGLRRAAAERDDARSTRVARTRGEALRPLDHGELPRGVRPHACNGILFNHESPRRGETFVTRKITRAVARSAGLQDDALPGQPGRAARLGLRARVRRGRCG